MRGSGAEQRLLRGCSGAVALRAVCPAQITAGAPQNAVGPQVAEKPVGAVGRDLGHRAQQSRVAVGGRRVLGGARRLEVLDLDKDTVFILYPTVLLERITLFRPRAFLIVPGRAAAQASARTYCLRGWASRITRFLGLSWPSAYSRTPAVTRALADNGTISGSTSAPETPCHRPGSCATPARAGEQWMRGTWSSGCSGAVGSPAWWSATPAVSQAGQSRQRGQPPCADRDDRGGPCDAPVAPRQGGSTATGRVRVVEQRRRGARRSSALRRSATARAAKRRQLQHELAIVVGPEMVATASRAPELNGGSGRSRLHGRRDTARAFRAAGQKRTRQVVKRRGSSS